jgi:hypothetical protein
MAPGQLRIVPEPAGVGCLATDLQSAVEADAAAGRRAGEDVEARVAQWLVPLLLLAVVVVLLLLLDHVSLLLLAVVMVLALLGQAGGGGREDDGGAGHERDQGAKADHDGG